MQSEEQKKAVAELLSKLKVPSEEDKVYLSKDLNRRIQNWLDDDGPAKMAEKALKAADDESAS